MNEQLKEEVLEFILDQIKKENESQGRNQTMSNDETNKKILEIFGWANYKFSSLDELIDDEDELGHVFGIDGLHAIRDAEAGQY